MFTLPVNKGINTFEYSQQVREFRTFCEVIGVKKSVASGKCATFTSFLQNTS